MTIYHHSKHTQNTPDFVQEHQRMSDTLFVIQTLHNIHRNSLYRSLIGLGFMVGGFAVVLIMMYIEGEDIRGIRQDIYTEIQANQEMLHIFFPILISVILIPLIPVIVARYKRYHQTRKRYIGTSDGLYIVTSDKKKKLYTRDEIHPYIHIESMDHTHRIITLYKRNKLQEATLQTIKKQLEKIDDYIPEALKNIVQDKRETQKQKQKHICAYIEGVDDKIITTIQDQTKHNILDITSKDNA